ncbi:MAG: BatD family protein [Myxococcota bacterium]|nr:BatD family protein [Myxococcota bacterium]
MKPRLSIAIALLSILASSASAQAPDGEVEMSVDRNQVEVGGIFQLRITATVQGGQAQLQPPDLAAFDVLSRSVSSGSVMRGFTRESRLTQTMQLRARQPGAFQLGPARIDFGGGTTIDSNVLQITVGGGIQAGQPAAQGGAPDLPPAHHADGMAFDPRGFLRTWVTDAEPYVGQQVDVTVYLYLRGPLRASPAITREATTDGFWTRDLLPPSRSLDARTQTLQNMTFQVYTLRHVAAFPLQAGEQTIGAPAMEVRNSGLWGLLGGGGNEPLRLEGVPVTVNVRPLPSEGRPDGDVHVGELTVTSELDRAQVGTGDAVTLTVRAEGRGAIEQIRIPSPSADGLRVLQPEIRDTVSTPGGVVRGDRVYRWLIVPERPGTYTLGPFEVPVFDPEAERYTVARAPALTLTAAGNAAAAAAEPEPAELEAPSGPAPDAPSFGPIHRESELTRSYATMVDRGWYRGLLALGPLMLLLGLVARAWRRRAASDDPARAPRRARKAARKRLAEAQAHAAGGEPRAFYAAIGAALKDVLQARLGQPVGSLTHPELSALLTRRGMEPELARAVVEELEGCDFARFSAAGVERAEMDECLTRARALLAKLDRFTPTAEDEA